MPPTPIPAAWRKQRCPAATIASCEACRRNSRVSRCRVREKRAACDWARLDDVAMKRVCAFIGHVCAAQASASFFRLHSVPRLSRIPSHVQNACTTSIANPGAYHAMPLFPIPAHDISNSAPASSLACRRATRYTMVAALVSPFASMESILSPRHPLARQSLPPLQYTSESSHQHQPRTQITRTHPPTLGPFVESPGISLFVSRSVQHSTVPLYPSIDFLAWLHYITSH